MKKIDIQNCARINCGFVILIISLLSCKKDKLEGDASLLVGKWKWVYSTVTYDLCSPPSYSDILTPSSEGNEYKLEIKEKGHIYLYKDNEKVEKRRVDLSYYQNSCGITGFQGGFSINLDGMHDDQYSFDGCVSSDSLRLIRGYPFQDTNCDSYINYFVRE